jgi:hypothetical protein
MLAEMAGAGVIDGVAGGSGRGMKLSVRVWGGWIMIHPPHTSVSV